MDHFGDIGFDIFIRPIRKDIFKFLPEAGWYLDDIPDTNIMRIINGMLTTTWTDAATAVKFPADIKTQSTLDENFLLSRRNHSSKSEHSRINFGMHFIRIFRE